MENDFTEEDDENLVYYLAFNSTGREDRRGDNLYQKLVHNRKRWHWSGRHTWLSWLTRYNMHQNSFDSRIRALQKEARTTSPHEPKRRAAFTPEEDRHLVSFLAWNSSLRKPGAWYNRSGNVIYRDVLVANAEKYPWSKTHPWQSWRDRYVKRIDAFDASIAKWQKRRGIDPDALQRDVEQNTNTLEGFTKRLDTSSSQAERASKENSSKAGQLGTKRRKDEEVEILSDTVPDDQPLPKRQKLSPGQIHPILSKHKSNEPAELVQRHLSTSPVVKNGIASQDGAEERDLPSVNSSHQDETSQVIQDTRRIEKSPQRKDDAERQQRSTTPHSKSDKASPVHPQKNNSLDEPSGRSPTNTPTHQRQLDRQSPALPQGSVASDSGHRSDATPMKPQVSNKQPSPMSNEDAESTRSPPTSLSHAAEDASTSSVPDLSLSVKLFPARFPGDSVDAPDDTNEDLRRPTPQQTAVEHSHHPTSPPINVQPETSIPSLSVVSGSPTLTAKPEEKSPPPPSPLDQHIPTPVKQTPVESTRPPLFASTPSPDPFVEAQSSSRHTAGLQYPLKETQQSSLDEASRNQNYRKQDTGDDESTSDGLFTSSPPYPCRPEVIRDFPRLRQGTSFRDGSWVRERRVIGGSNNQKSLRREALSRKKVTASDGGAGTQESIPPKLQDPPPDVHEGTKVIRDVFHAQTPIASDSKHEPFVLSTTNLPEPGTASSVSHAQLDSPVPRNKTSHVNTRRQTFAGFNSRSSIPSINLVEKLGKHPSHQSSLGTRRSSLDTTNSGSLTSTGTRLTAPEHRADIYRPPRASAIPNLVDMESQRAAPDLLDTWSPSTRNLVVQAGLASIFKRMEENHGFSTDVVRRAWLQQNMDLGATDRMLLRMRIAAENASRDEFYAGEVKQRSLSSGKALDGAKKVFEVSSAHVTPEPEPDYTPPARSRAERYQLLKQGFVQGERQHEPNLVSRNALSSSKKGEVLSQAVWSHEEDEILRSGDEDKLQVLVNKFSEDTVRRRFVAIMRETAL